MDISRVRIDCNKPFPGNEIELRLYRAVFNKVQTGLNSKFSKLFSDNGWSVPWVNGVYDFHHFHAEAHEVLGCAAGWVLVQMGGSNGPEVRLEAGDAVLIPAGVAHKNIDSSADYYIVLEIALHNARLDLQWMHTNYGGCIHEKSRANQFVRRGTNRFAKDS